jgi:MFS family permease
LLLGEFFFLVVYYVFKVRLSFRLSSLLIVLGGVISFLPSLLLHSHGHEKHLYGFGLGRIIVGFGLGGSLTVVNGIITEISDVQISVIYGVIGNIGLVIAPLTILALTCPQLSISTELVWRTALCIGSFPSLLTVVFDLEKDVRLVRHCDVKKRITSLFGCIKYIIKDIIYIYIYTSF